jgi:hypothetical protein
MSAFTGSYGDSGGRHREADLSSAERWGLKDMKQGAMASRRRERLKGAATPIQG